MSATAEAFDFFNPEQLERQWQATLAEMRAAGVDVDEVLKLAGEALPKTVEEMDARRRTPLSEAERAEWVRFIMEGPL